MQPTRSSLIAALLLAAVFSAVHLRLAYPPLPKPLVVRHWGTPHMLLSDSVVYGFVRELLAQSDTVENHPDNADSTRITISHLLVEHQVIPLFPIYPKNTPDSDINYLYGRLPAGLLQQMYKKKLLSIIDTIHMKQQVKYSKGFGLEQRFVSDGYNVISADSMRRLYDKYSFSINEYFDKKYGTATYTQLSCPIFSVDKRIVIVSVNPACAGGCGDGATYVLERRRNKWYKLFVIEE
ncbi:hypothetical protein [Hymenobacter perfusus]|uniref:Uncharacterized protein n=1 Tax=Hymenobacter perfusus TaxID=1236770 RepID=A0A428KHL4_9BACT|nr:hypothetical protein [Hymenobacter perfusus]RSK45942.1 hypothetical protein EI293_01850 [Hymenobacter perfusus]